LTNASAMDTMAVQRSSVLGQACEKAKVIGSTRQGHDLYRGSTGFFEVLAPKI
jgi:hypothetical protein